MSAKSKKHQEQGENPTLLKGRVFRLFIMLVGVLTGLIGVTFVTAGSASAAPAPAVPTATFQVVKSCEGTVTASANGSGFDPAASHSLNVVGRSVYDVPATVAADGSLTASTTFTPLAGQTSIALQISADADGTVEVGPVDTPITDGCVKPPTEVTPQPPTVTKVATCASNTETITPSTQDGVQWTPAGASTLKPGESVVFNASAAQGFVFPKGGTTQWSFTNTFDTKTCQTVTPTPSKSPTKSSPSKSVGGVSTTAEVVPTDTSAAPSALAHTGLGKSILPLGIVALVMLVGGVALLVQRPRRLFGRRS